MKHTRVHVKSSSRLVYLILYYQDVILSYSLLYGACVGTVYILYRVNVPNLIIILFEKYSKK